MTDSSMAKKLILIDGNAIFYRAYHALPPFKTSKGEPTNAIYGFLRMLLDIYRREKPDYLGIAWDHKAPTFRHEAYTDYKATRIAPPEDLYPQLPHLKEILKAFHIPLIDCEGFEADDILGTLAKQAGQYPEIKTIIVTGDRDTLQLVNDYTSVMMPVKGVSQVTLYDSKAVEEKFGIKPEQIIDYKALAGDTSDNIPGVPGIGPKQATELIQRYGNLENIYSHLQELSIGQQKKLTEGKESAFLSKKLVTIEYTVPCNFHVEDYSVKPPDREKIKQLMSELEITSLQKEVDAIEGFQSPLTTSSEQLSLF